MVYVSQLWQRVFQFTYIPFRLDKWLFRMPQGWSIAFKIAMRYTVDNAGSPPSSATGTHDYQYKPFGNEGEIRLLKLRSGERGDSIQASLVAVQLANTPPYEAVSYVWGSNHTTTTISVDDQSFRVWSGQADALVALRKPDSVRLIWIDAICINQADLHEKAHQVSIMTRIYEKAKSVAVYLGKPTEKTAEAMRALRHFTETRNESNEPPWSYVPLPEAEDTLRDILKRPWFTRIWTVQEVTLARHTTFVCGDHELSWSGDLRSLRRILFRIKSAAISPYFSVASGHKSNLDWSPLLDILETQMRQAARREGVVLHRNQLDLAYQFRHRECYDPRDKYFAIFNIIENDEGAQLDLAPSYTDSLEHVHRRFTAEMQRISEMEDA